MLITGAVMLVGALSGARDPLQPLAGLRGGTSSEATRLSSERIRSVAELDARIKATGQPVMLDFLRRLVRVVQGNGAVYLRRCASAVDAGWTLLQADVTRQLGRRQGVFGAHQALRSSWNHLL